MNEQNRIECLDASLGLWRVTGETNGYLIVRGRESLLIDCPDAAAAAAVRAAGLPPPGVVLHTQVQEEHCREWAAFPAARVHVAEASREVALRSARFFADCRTVWPPSREWSTLGEELYGIAGCTTERPPAQPLNVAGVLRPGEAFRWADVELGVVALPGSGRRAIGFHWAAAGVVFSGDLVHAGGRAVNLYDLERGYGTPNGRKEAARSLTALAALAPRRLLPTSGPAIDDPAGDIARLVARLAQPLRLPARRAGSAPAIVNYTPRREFGRYRQVLDGLYQNTNFGNMVLYVDGAGRGLVVDPDFCVWLSWEENCRQMHADLDLLERETGLRRVERLLITHYHGDHIQYADLFRERYGAVVSAPPDVAACMETPERFPYPCMVNWYGFPFLTVRVDVKVAYERALDWNGVGIVPVHTPGHCYAHAGYLIPWQGHRTFCAGDVIQYGSGPIGGSFPFCYNDNGWPDRSPAVTFRRVAALRPDLVLGGHSHSFFDPDGTIVRDFLEQAEEAERQVADLVAGDLLRATTPPGFDECRPPSV